MLFPCLCLVVCYSFRGLSGSILQCHSLLFHTCVQWSCNTWKWFYGVFVPRCRYPTSPRQTVPPEGMQLPATSGARGARGRSHDLPKSGPTSCKRNKLFFLLRKTSQSIKDSKILLSTSSLQALLSVDSPARPSSDPLPKFAACQGSGSKPEFQLFLKETVSERPPSSCRYGTVSLLWIRWDSPWIPCRLFDVWPFDIYFHLSFHVLHWNWSNMVWGVSKFVLSDRSKLKTIWEKKNIILTSNKPAKRNKDKRPEPEGSGYTPRLAGAACTSKEAYLSQRQPGFGSKRLFLSFSRWSLLQLYPLDQEPWLP